MGAGHKVTRIWRPILPALTLSVLATVWCWFAVGAGLALLLCATSLAALYVPPLAAVESGWDRVTSTLCAIMGVVIVWAATIGSIDITFGEWLRCSLVLGAFAVALFGCVSLLLLAKIPWPLAAFLTMLLALLWLTWPVWLSHALAQQRVDWLVPAHPLLAINGVVAHLGVWDRMPIAYRWLTVLNQDISYRLPRSIMPAVLVHVAIGAAGLVLALRRAIPRVAAESMPAIAPAPPPTGAP